MIRQATEKDIASILPLVNRFWGIMDYKVSFDPEYSAALLRMSCEHNLLFLLELDGRAEGFLCMIKSPLIGNANYSMASELAFWVNPEHRNSTHSIRLLKHAIAQCIEQNVHFVTMTLLEHSAPERIDKLYRRLGFKPVERNYRRVLWQQ